ncbi:MAG TPA: endolytic transglycosylase MltG [Actinocrinis sp.]|nr:endolytic transglycosylase MltG [Actinocrinis sp.]
MSENWSQGGSGEYGEDPYSRSEPRPENSGRGRRRAAGPPPDGVHPDAARSRAARPQDPYASGSYDTPSYAPGSGPGQSGPNRYGLGAYDPAASYGGGAGTSGSHDTGAYDPGYETGSQRAGGRPGGSGAYPTDPRAADPYASGGYPANAAPRRPQGPPPPSQPPHPAQGRAPYGGAPQPARGTYGQGYETGGGAPGADYESGSHQTGQYDRRAAERPGYERPARERAAAPGYDRQPYEAEAYSEPAYREDPRQASGTGGRRRAAEPAPVAEEEYDYDGYDQDEYGEDPQPRSRRRGGRRDEADDDFQLIDEDQDEDSGGRGGRRPKQAKRGRNCLAVLVSFALIVGVLGYGGYWAYKHFGSHNSQPADYTATTNPQVIDVVIPQGAGGSQIGQILFSADVIKSQGSFINACTGTSQCAQIQADTYLLPKEISAQAALGLLLNPTSVDKKGQLNTYGGERAAQIFAEVEKKKGWTQAQIVTAMTGGQIDLPAWDTGKAGTNFPFAPIEGFICAEQYDLDSYSTPQALMKKMVDDQLAVFTTDNLAAKATSLNVTEYQLLTIASMAQAEAANANDLPNIAEVVFNRLKDKAEFNHLGFDTVTLYGMGNTVTSPSAADLRDTSNPYNTHLIDGLPPTPIDNPDTAALTAVTAPTPSTYVYFCAISSTTTEYASNDAQWLQLGKQYPKQCGGG